MFHNTIYSYPCFFHRECMIMTMFSMLQESFTIICFVFVFWNQLLYNKLLNLLTCFVFLKFPAA